MCSNVCGNLQQIDGDSCILACLNLRGLIKYLCKLMGISPFDLMGSSLDLNIFLKLKDIFSTGRQESGVGKSLHHILNKIN